LRVNDAAPPMELNAPQAIYDIARELERHGFESWAVGGAVRDALAGRNGGDWDITTNARPDQVRSFFRRTVPIGIEHGTIGVFGRDGVLYEVTTFRLDVETDGRHAVVKFADTLDEDLARRDFTINAVAWNPLTGELFDPWDGIEDLQRRVLRTVGEPDRRFAEDYLRVLRAFRFAGHFLLAIEPATWAAACDAVAGLDGLSAERVREEIVKVLTRTRVASRALRLYSESGAFARLLPELAATGGVEPAPGRDAFTLALAATDAVAPGRPRLRLAALLHTLGFPAARTRDLRGGWRFTGHEPIAARKADEVLRRLKASNADTEAVVSLIAMQSDLFPPDSPDPGIRRWLAHVTPGRVNDLFRLRIAIWRANPVERGDRDLVQRWKRARTVMRSRPVLTLDGLVVDGNDLRAHGVEAGPAMGRILRALLERVIEEPHLNQRDALLSIAREMASS
jgi:tRNA nucleotidyltransferase (CCA-adding enzyme)